MKIFQLPNIWQYIIDASMLIFPERCAICRRRLRKGEKFLCIKCYATLPFTHIKGKPANKVERMFWGKIPIVRASAFLKYLPQSESSRIFHLLKYGNRPEIGKFFGQVIANELIGTDFFNGIDYLIPLPLAVDRLKKRGYNQSEAIASGIQTVTHIPINTQAIRRHISNPSQTHLSLAERKENVKNIFRINSTHELEGKHILLIDDIMTTGSTLLSCAKELSKIPGINISIITLGLAGVHYTISRNPPTPRHQ